MSIPAHFRDVCNSGMGVPTSSTATTLHPGEGSLPRRGRRPGRVGPASGGTADLPDGVDPGLAGHIRAAQVGAVVRATPLTAAVNVLNAGLVVLTFWNDTPVWPLLAWFALVASLAALALRAWHRSRQRPAPTAVSPRALRRTTLHAFLFAAAWGAVPAALFAGADPFGRFVLGCLAAGMITGGAFAVSAVPRAGFAYTWTLSLLMVAGLAASGEPVMLAAAALLCLYAAFVSRNLAAHGALLAETLRGRREIEAQREVLGLVLRDFEDSASDCLWETDAADRLRRAPPRLARALGLAPDAVEGASLPALLRRRPDDAGADVRASEACLDTCLSRRRAFRDVLATGGERVWSLTGRPVRDQAGVFRGFRGVATDVTDRVRAEARATFLAGHDLLTGLPNRREFTERLAAALADAVPGGPGIALLLLDLDRFKPINDLHGHATGDALLCLVAARLRAAMRDTDLVARFGGDEFALVVDTARLESGDQSDSAAATDRRQVAVRLAQRIVAALDQPFVLDAGRLTVQVGGSIGVALAPDSGIGVEDLLRHADAALHSAKADGRACFRLFDPAMDERLRERVTLEAELRRAVAADGLEPYFQPLVSLDTGRVRSFEMLARWPHPTRGLVSPAEFIPLAEDAGLIGPLTENLLRRGCRAALDWPEGVSLAVNVSPLQLRDRALPALVRAVLRDTGLAPQRLEVELTESALVADFDLAREVVMELRAAGVRVALDDFGTGYSSLKHLQTLPFDKLKIDASFVRAMATDSDSQKIVAAVVGLGHSLGMPTVAEGVEDEGAAATLRGLGCDLGQGYLFGRPMPAADAAAFALESTATPVAPTPPRLDPALGLEPRRDA